MGEGGCKIKPSFNKNKQWVGLVDIEYIENIFDSTSHLMIIIKYGNYQAFIKININ